MRASAVFGLLALLPALCKPSPTRVYVLTSSQTWQRIGGPPRSASTPEAQAYFEKLGYVSATKDNVEFFYSPDIWPKKQLENLLDALMQSRTNVGQHGLIDSIGAPAMLSLARDIFRDSYDVPTDEPANYALQGGVVIKLEANGKTVSFQDSVKADEGLWSGLLAKPLPQSKVSDHSKHQATSEPSLTGIIAFSDYHFECFGPDALNGFRRATALRTGSDIRDDALEAVRKEIEKAKSLLIRELALKGAGNDWTGLEKGTDVKQLPPAIGSRLTNYVASNWSHLGFSSEEDARLWGQNARVGDWSPTIQLFGARMQNGTRSLLGYGL